MKGLLIVSVVYLFSIANGLPVAEPAVESVVEVKSSASTESVLFYGSKAETVVPSVDSLDGNSVVNDLVAAPVSSVGLDEVSPVADKSKAPVVVSAQDDSMDKVAATVSPMVVPESVPEKKVKKGKSDEGVVASPVVKKVESPEKVVEVVPVVSSSSVAEVATEAVSQYAVGPSAESVAKVSVPEAAPVAPVVPSVPVVPVAAPVVPVVSAPVVPVAAPVAATPVVSAPVVPVAAPSAPAVVTPVAASAPAVPVAVALAAPTIKVEEVKPEVAVTTAAAAAPSSNSDISAYLAEPINQATKLLVDLEQQIKGYLSTDLKEDAASTLSPLSYGASSDEPAIEPTSTDARQNEQIAGMVDQIEMTIHNLDQSIEDLMANRRYMTAAMMRSMRSYLRGVQNNLQRLQNRLRALQAVASSAAAPPADDGSGSGGYPSNAFFESLRVRVNRITSDITNLMNRMRSTLVSSTTARPFSG